MYEDRALAQSQPRVYSGVYDDAWCLGRVPSQGGEGAGPIVLFCVLDVPLSAIADTVVMPVSVRWNAPRERIDGDGVSALVG
jgi:uncharacterized protein YceK